ncbi:MAG: nitronate monooxygenase [Candidatus Sericytochromatia bacterium]|nr:nitronate monooxygenase [Candidatus Sericytochromatia bacterium]
MRTAITDLFGISYPIVQAGMVWCSGSRLAAAASNAGALGLVGGGSMRPDTFREHLRAMPARTNLPWGVNIPIFHKYAADQIAIALEEGVRIVFTSAGNPKTYTPLLKQAGVTVVHVVATGAQARKSQDAGCDAVVAEGFEAGGHNGPDELTTMVLTRLAVQAVSIPVIAAGGVADGFQMCAALALGAAGVQLGSRFAVTQESSAHAAYKQAVCAATENATVLGLKAIGPARYLKNEFARAVQAAEANGAPPAELQALLGSGRARRGIFEGELDQGELEVGQVAGLIADVPTAAEVVARLLSEYAEARGRLP